jgi:hypothetical protein
MPAAGNDRESAPAAKWGCRRERGTLRTSASRVTSWAFNSATKSSSERVE